MTYDKTKMIRLSTATVLDERGTYVVTFFSLKNAGIPKHLFTFTWIKYALRMSNFVPVKNNVEKHLNPKKV